MYLHSFLSCTIRSVLDSSRHPATTEHDSPSWWNDGCGDVEEDETELTNSCGLVGFSAALTYTNKSEV